MADYEYFIKQNEHEIGPEQLVIKAEFVTMFSRIIGAPAMLPTIRNPLTVNRYPVNLPVSWDIGHMWVL